MKYLIVLFIASFLSAQNYDLSVFNTKKAVDNKKASQNEKIICRMVCDKKIYKEQVIGEAINFYKSSKRYHFYGSQ